MMIDIIDNQVIEILGYFSQEVLFDSQLFKKIKIADYNITEYSGFNRKLWEKFGLRKNIMYYGLSLKEKALNIEATSNKIEIPLLEKRELIQRIQKINEKDRYKIGWIYIGSIQMILNATFREGIDTPIDLALLDNRIVNKKEAILGIIKGNLKYQNLIFNIYPKIAYNLADKDFHRTLSLIQDFKRQDFMRECNKPYSITYKIAYALSNTHHIEYFAQKDYIDLPLLFHEIGRVYPPETSTISFQDDFLLDIGDEPKYLDSRPSCSSLTLTNDKIHYSKRITFHTLEQNKKITNYKIKGQYFNGHEWQKIDILIDTGASSSYISKSLTFMLDLSDLDELVTYINFNGENFRVTKFCTVVIRLNNQEIKLPLMVEDEGENDTISIMLGMTFLEKCKPWHITSEHLMITINNNQITIPKCDAP